MLEYRHAYIGFISVLVWITKIPSGQWKPSQDAFIFPLSFPPLNSHILDTLTCKTAFVVDRHRSDIVVSSPCIGIIVNDIATLQKNERDELWLCMKTLMYFFKKELLDHF